MRYLVLVIALLLGGSTIAHARVSSGVPGLIGALSPAAQKRYREACTAQARRHGTDLMKGRYLPPKFDVIRWNDGTPRVGGTRLAERVLIDALVDGRARRVFVEARGGLGKSRLADAIEAQACQRVAVIRLDLPTAARVHDPEKSTGVGWGVDAIAAKLGIDPAAGEGKGLHRLLGEHPWVILADSFDEVAREQRGAIRRILARLLEPYAANGRAVILGRPGLGFESGRLHTLPEHLRLPPLTCETVRERTRIFLGSKSADEKFWEVAARFGFDRGVRWLGRCVYPCMATWRDLITMVKVLPTAPDPSTHYQPPWTSRAAIYDFFVRILGTLSNVPDASWGTGIFPSVPTDIALDMVAARMKTGGLGAGHFSREECEQAARKNKVASPKEYCQQLFDSKLFKPGGGGTHRLKNRSILDALAARAIARRVNLSKKNGCRVIAKQDALDDSVEIAAFLADEPAGRRCLGEVADALCARKVLVDDTVLLLEAALSMTGSRRMEILASARKSSARTTCGMKVLDVLGRTEGAVPKPSVAEKPAVGAAKGGAQ